MLLVLIRNFLLSLALLRRNSHILQLIMLRTCDFPFRAVCSSIGHTTFGHSRFIAVFSKCDGKLTKIPKTGLYFRTCEYGAGWHLIPYGISPRSEFFSQAYKNWHFTWGINLEPDWPPLAKGFQISHYHTPTRPLNFFPLDNRRLRAYRS